MSSQHHLITGNMGYIGPVVAAHLRQSSPASRVRGFDTGFFAGVMPDPTEFPERFINEQWIGDVRNPPSGLFAGIAGVVHLAAISNDPMGNQFEEVTTEINHRQTLAMAKAAKAAGCGHFVFASSCSVYGAGGDDAKSEDSPLNPLTAYARSKIDSEEGLRALAEPGFTVTCLRFATACGWSPRLRLDLVLNDFVAGALVSKRIDILSDGTPWRPLIHVRDMARAIHWALERDAGNGGDFLVVNAGSDAWNYQVRDLAEAVAGELDGVTLSINEAAAPDKRSYRVDFSRFRDLAPRHQPLETLPGAVADLARELRRCGFNDPDYRSSKLIRLKVLAGLRTAGRVDDQLRWML